MNAKPLLLLCISLACFIFSSCQQPTQAVAVNAANDVAFREDFSGASKPTYTSAIINFKTGDWYLADALIGTSKSDVTESGAAVRIRNSGKLGMGFDVNGAQRVYVGYAVYANDQPSTWQLWMSTNGGDTYRQVGSTITAGNRTVQKIAFDVDQTGNVRFEIRKASGGKNRLLITSLAIAASGVVNTPPKSSGNNEQLTATAGDNSNTLLGNPTNALHNLSSGDNYLIDHGYYIESYNKTKCTPNWVSWHIGASDLGNVNRVDNFRPDASLPNGWYAVDDDDYKGSGFDKGHNCPSGDRTATTQANASTFFMDNIIPQAPNNNQRTWEHLESYCRDQIKKGNEVYVIMGNYGSGGTGSKGYTKSINQGKINVPARIWKVVVIIPNGNNDLSRIDNNTRVIAVDTPNDNSIAPDWMQYITTVAAIEKATGVDLLSALPDNIENVLAKKKFSGGN
ncbi:DNA/RNA non-specific endonuclease [Ilyomonas limi]|uniref:DNA/RNA non-specific endonuclease n=1 Tax=Ilyomonas limi TaxID=2575867 RepID=A0A4U3L4T6_9BACT|nr:DNA/RNA non-specific endonuclease [Ilyomonas limi]TKK69344.1 DNA/RNA non-specific endonuclease [Ilyomonas limi]